MLDRVTAINYSDGTPGTGYAYDVGAFGKGRLSSITREGQTISYGYDRFGRVTQDDARTPLLTQATYFRSWDPIENPSSRTCTGE